MIDKEIPYSIELYLGEKRSGKTLGMIAETYQLVKQKPKKIYANFSLNKNIFPDFTLINKKDLENFYKNSVEFSDCIFLIDEIHILMDSRTFGSKGNQHISYFLGQMGKRSNIFRGTTHFPHMIDFRLRAYCEKWNYCRKGFYINNNFSYIMNNNILLTDEENENLYIQIKPVVRKLVDYDFYNVQLNKIYIKAKDFFNMYDTKELIKPN
jgi:hypothetical protein